MPRVVVGNERRSPSRKSARCRNRWPCRRDVPRGGDVARQLEMSCARACGAQQVAGQEQPEPLGHRAARDERGRWRDAQPRHGRGARQWVHRLKGRRRSIEFECALPGRRRHARREHHHRAAAVDVRMDTGRRDADRLQRVQVREQHREARAVGIGEVGVAETECRLRPRGAGRAQALRIQIRSASLHQVGHDQWIAALDQSIHAVAVRQQLEVGAAESGAIRAAILALTRNVVSPPADAWP